MTGYSDEAKVTDLLAPLRGLEPLPLAVPKRRERRLSRPVLVTAVVLLALALTGVAVADRVGAFEGIGATQRPPGTADRLDPGVVAAISHSGLQFQPDSARLVAQLPGGARIYAVATSTGELCTLAERLPNNNGKDDAAAMGCGSPLTQSQPTTIASFQTNESTQPISYGIARDGVTAVSFMAGGEEVTVAVESNVWVYEGETSALDSLTVHYADGTTRVLDH